MTTLKTIDKAIATFTTNRDKLRDSAHDILMMIVNHAAPKEAGPDAEGSGNCTRALKLMEQMPASWAEQADAWLRAFTPIRVVVVNQKCEFDPAYKKLNPAQKPEQWNIEEAAQKPFWEFQPERAPQEPKSFEELVNLVHGLGKRINKMAEEGNVKDEDLDSAKAMSERLSTLRFSRVKPSNDDDSENAKTVEEAAA